MRLCKNIIQFLIFSCVTVAHKHTLTDSVPSPEQNVAFLERNSLRALSSSCAFVLIFSLQHAQLVKQHFDDK